MSTTPTAPTAMTYLMLTPAVTQFHDVMNSSPTLRMTAACTMQAAFQPEQHFTNDDPWMTVQQVTRVDVLGLVLLSLQDGNVILMTEDEYASQV